MDIRPPKRRPNPQSSPSAKRQSLPNHVTRPLAQAPVVAPLEKPRATMVEPPTKSVEAGVGDNRPGDQPKVRFQLKLRRRFIIAIVLVLVAVFVACSYIWWTLMPRGGDAMKQRITITNGESLQSIAQNLEDHDIIRNAFTFEWYVRFRQAYPNIKAGGFVLTNQQSASDILGKITSDDKEIYMVTIAPGLTLEELADPTITNSLASQGFTKKEIEAAYNAEYKSKLLVDKPSEATLEGYIFPETYQMDFDQTLEDVFERTFDELYGRLERDKLIDAYRAAGLNLHQAITLASVVQKEVKDETDQKQVAQVFLSRLKNDMVLGSDVTFMYAAKKMGVTPSVDLDSPYNTRKYPGLPPGPISNMNYSALQAVASPAPGDYLYFVAGDDGKTYYSRTEDEHNSNVAAHCTVLCR